MRSFLFALLLVASTAHAEVTLVGVAVIPGTALDRSGLRGKIQNGAGAETEIPQAAFGSAGSAIDFTGNDDLYLMASDRGPNDGDARYLDRVHTVRINVQAEGTGVSVEVVGTTFLKDEKGRNFTGSASPSGGALRFDPEGIRHVGDGGNGFWISDEYGPYVFQFDSEGKKARSFPVPMKYMGRVTDANAAAELAANKMGRQPNRGMEGLAISPDGKTLFGILQSPLIQDHGVDPAYKRTGQLIRILAMDVAHETTREYVYPLDSATLGISEILAIGPEKLLVIERDGKGGAASTAKKITKIDLARATDVSKPFVVAGRNHDYTGTTPLNGLSASLPVPGVMPVVKTPFLDLLDSRFNLRTSEFPEKIEGLTWGPDFANGDKLLIVTSDNDFIATAPTCFYAFRVSRDAIK